MTSSSRASSRISNPEPTELRIFTATGAWLTHWRIDLRCLAFERLGSLRFPANIQYAWPHPSLRRLYVASSNGGGRHGPAGDLHHVSACDVEEASGSLNPAASRISLPSRPIHLTCDPSASHVLLAFNHPSAIRVYALDGKGELLSEVAQVDAPFAGNYAHQVRVTADEKQVVATALGGNAMGGRPEDPGSINLFDYTDGRLENHRIVAPNRGFGFGPRHLDIHPNGRWVYVSLERQNRLETYELHNGTLIGRPEFSRDLLSGPPHPGITQSGGTVHIHPSGRFLYVVNRASDTVVRDGLKVFAGGENTFAVYRIDEDSGAPELIQHVDTQGFHCRTFHIDSSGQWLAAAHIAGMNIMNDRSVDATPAYLTLFHISQDGRLSAIHRQPMQTMGESMFWAGLPNWSEGASTSGVNA